MTDQGFKELLGFILRNRDEISEALNCFKAEDVERGLLAVQETLLNLHLRNLILEKSGELLSDYSVKFQNGSIYLNAELNHRQLGPVQLRYRFTIEDLYFDESHRRLFFTYQEDVRSGGNMLQAMALKAFMGKGTFLQSVVQMAKLPFLRVRGSQAELNLEKIDLMKKLPESLGLRYISCQDGLLKLSFHI